MATPVSSQGSLGPTIHATDEAPRACADPQKQPPPRGALRSGRFLRLSTRQLAAFPTS